MLRDAPRRIVSLVPSHTETLHALGLADRVVGRTRFCIHPAPWVDGIAAVGGTKDAKPKALVEALQQAGVEVLWSDIATVPDAAGFVVRLGQRCGVADAGAVHAKAIRDAAAAAQGAGAGLSVFCPIWHDPWMTFDDTAYPSAVLDVVGLRNAFAGHAGNRYFEVSPAEVAASPATWTLLPTEPYPFHTRRAAVETGSLGRAGRPECVRVIDGEALTWFGVRTAPGLLELAKVARDLAAADARQT